jgi:carotenoid cleavage dioxygenase
MPLGGATSAIRWVEIENCYVFHGMNAFRAGDDVVIDVSRMAKVFDGSSMGPPPHLHRWRVNTSGAALTFHDEQRTDTFADLPSIDRRRTGRPYTHGWRVVTRNDPDVVDLGGVVHIEANSATETHWDPGAQFSCDEWLLVPTGEAEAEGVVMTFVYDKANDRSELVILDARDVAAGPLARVALPTRVPYGFHGTWVPSAEG